MPRLNAPTRCTGFYGPIFILSLVLFSIGLIEGLIHYVLSTMVTYIETAKGTSTTEIANKINTIYSVGDAVQIFGFGIWWCYLSDRNLRKPLLITSLSLTLFISMMYGFCTNYAGTFSVRVIKHIVDATIPLTLAYLSDLVKVNDNQFRTIIAFMLATTAYLSGELIGTYFVNKAHSIGGILYGLFGYVQKMPIYIDSSGIHKKFPFIYPFLIAVVPGIIAVLLCAFLLRPPQNSERDFRFSFKAISTEDDDDERDSFLEYKTEQTKFQKIKSWMFVRKNQILTLFAHSRTVFLYEGLWQLAISWLLLRADDFGLSMNGMIDDLSLISLGSRISILLFIVYYVIARKLGEIWALRLGVALMGLCSLLFPFTGSLHIASHARSFFVFVMTIVSLGRAFSMASVHTMISNVSKSSRRGLMFGIAYVVTCLNRSVASPLFSELLNSTMKHKLPFPVDYHLPFLILVFGSIVTIVMTKWMDKHKYRQLQGTWNELSH